MQRSAPFRRNTRAFTVAFFLSFLFVIFKETAERRVSKVSVSQYIEDGDSWAGCSPYTCNGQEDCPAIVHMIEELLHHLMESDYFVNLGSLLGLMRENSLFPNAVDKDFDIFLEKRHFEQLNHDTNFKHAMYARGYLLFQDQAIFSGEWANLRFCVSKLHPDANDEIYVGPYYDTFRFIDIWPFEETLVNGSRQLNIMSTPFDQMSTENKMRFQKLKNIKLRPTLMLEYGPNLKIKLPRYPESVLNALYPNWKNNITMTEHGNV